MSFMLHYWLDAVARRQEDHAACKSTTPIISKGLLSGLTPEQRKSNVAIGGITANCGFQPPKYPPSRGRIRAPKCYLGPHHTSVRAKWHLILSNDFSRVHECDR